MTMVADDRKKEVLGTDLKLFESFLGSDLSVSTTGDLDTTSEDMNLAQAILHRLRTIKGELSDTGHTNYGSTLYDFIGEPNNEFTRERLRLAVRTTLLQEPRIKEITSIAVRVRPRIYESSFPKEEKARATVGLARITEEGWRIDKGRGGGGNDDHHYFSHEISEAESFSNSVDIDIRVIPIESNVPMNIVFPFYLEGAI